MLAPPGGSSRALSIALSTQGNKDAASEECDYKSTHLPNNKMEGAAGEHPVSTPVES
jgi:hypothetical protein